MPSDDYNKGFDAGEKDRHAEKPAKENKEKSKDYKEGYKHGQSGTSSTGKG